MLIGARKMMTAGWAVPCKVQSGLQVSSVGSRAVVGQAIDKRFHRST
jgi:hypothetical protein